ncbi:hypothetical protein ANCCAN_13388 [Ancylostoma caninum]|uniref:Uncharacterized protein n=1 Tax=Ancylostoma caninum TaxID=29170 RepID=A0A368GCF7_ANCCA|nr:hypothetical protein ANCCAN_13388 [Ancylostoma caninum]
MGSGSSSHQNNQDLMEHHHQYPDMNMIFKGIPKMIQVADDMHRMTDYIMDLRNMTIGLVIISVIGVCGFLLLRLVQGRSSSRRRKRSLIRQVCPPLYYVDDLGTGLKSLIFFLPEGVAYVNLTCITDKEKAAIKIACENKKFYINTGKYFCIGEKNSLRKSEFACMNKFRSAMFENFKQGFHQFSPCTFSSSLVS